MLRSFHGLILECLRPDHRKVRHLPAAVVLPNMRAMLKQGPPQDKEQSHAAAAGSSNPFSPPEWVELPDQGIGAALGSAATAWCRAPWILPSAPTSLAFDMQAEPPTAPTTAKSRRRKADEAMLASTAAEAHVGQFRRCGGGEGGHMGDHMGVPSQPVAPTPECVAPTPVAAVGVRTPLYDGTPALSEAARASASTSASTSAPVARHGGNRLGAVGPMMARRYLGWDGLHQHVDELMGALRGACAELDVRYEEQHENSQTLVTHATHMSDQVGAGTMVAELWIVTAVAKPGGAAGCALPTNAIRVKRVSGDTFQFHTFYRRLREAMAPITGWSADHSKNGAHATAAGFRPLATEESEAARVLRSPEV